MLNFIPAILGWVIAAPELPNANCHALSYLNSYKSFFAKFIVNNSILLDFCSTGKLQATHWKTVMAFDNSWRKPLECRPSTRIALFQLQNEFPLWHAACSYYIRWFLNPLPPEKPGYGFF